MQKSINDYQIEILNFIKKNQDPKECRMRYIDSLMKLSPDKMLKETEQILLDIIDIVEQTDEETPVIAAYNAFLNSLKNK